MSGRRQRAWRSYADARRRVLRAGSAQGAAPAMGSTSRGDREAWTAQLAAHHHAYRSSIPPSDERVGVVCVSHRAHHLGAVIENVVRQNHRPLEFVLVTNSAAFDEIDVDAALETLRPCGIDATVLRRSPSQTLGACLNDGIEVMDSRLVAKFDDDDRYGPDYLADSLRAHSYSGAGVVGKHTYYAFVAAAERTVLRFPANEFRYSRTLAGGTLVIDRERTGDVRFDDVSLGEDRSFLADCHRRGVSTFSADRFNYVQFRAHDNTWAISDAEFLTGTVAVGEGLQIDVIDI